MKKRLFYKIQELNREQRELFEIYQEVGFPHIVSRAFAIRDAEDGMSLMTQDGIFDPYLLKDMDKAIDYLFNALINRKDICVVADYDADGATSCAIMIKGMLNFGQSYDNIHYFLPDRQIHGYGLQPSVIDDMLKHYPNVETIVTVDNGISAVIGVDYAVSKNIDVVVTDHHAEGDSRPTNAIAIVNPNRKDDTFPSKALAGCGVAYYVISSLSKKFKEIAKDKNALQKYSNTQIEIIKKASQFNPNVLQDYLAIGTIADVVKLDANNRLLIESGLKRIREGHASIGVKALLAVKGIDDSNVYQLTTENIAFGVAPTLNAVGRLDDMTLGVKMLLSNDMSSCIELAEMANEFNKDRKMIENDMVESANYIISQQNFDDFKFSCAVLIDGHEGVVGIVASRIKEKLYKPTIAFVNIEETHEGHSLIKGSGRSIAGLHIRDAIDYVTKKSPDCVIKYGGHAMAAGLTIRKDKLQEFQIYFDEYCANMFHHEVPTMIHIVDEELNLNKVKIEDIDEMNMQIWGQGYTKPIFMGKFRIHKQHLLKDKVTKENAHLKLELEQIGRNIFVNAIWFKRKETIEVDEVDLIYQLNINRFAGEENLQIMIIDAAPAIREDF